MRILSCICLGLLLLGCAKDDESGMPEETRVPQDLVVVYSSEDNLFTTTLSGNAQNASNTNLTTTLGIPVDYSNFNARQDQLSFNKRQNNFYDFWEVDLLNDSPFTITNVCEFEEFEGVLAASNTREKLVQFTRQSIADELNNFIHIYDKQARTCQKTFLGVGGLAPNSSYAIAEDYVIVYLDAATVPVLINKVSLDTGLITHQITLDQQAHIKFANDELHVFYVDGLYQTYSAQNLELLSEGTFNYSRFFASFGIFNTAIENNNMLIDLGYPQPSTFISGPALVNLNTSELIAGEDYFLFELKTQVQAILEQVVFEFTTYQTNMQTGLIAVGYRLSDDTGGVIYTNFQAEVLKIVPLPFKPVELVLR